MEHPPQPSPLLQDLTAQFPQGFEEAMKMEIDPSEVPPCELFGNLNQGMCVVHASSLSPQTTINELSNITKALGPQNFRKKTFARLKEEEPILISTDLDTRTESDQNECRITSVNFTATGELLVADIGNSKVKVFDSNGHLKFECFLPKNQGGLLEPSGVCSGTSGDIVVADKMAGDIKVFDKEGHYLNHFGQDMVKPCDIVVNNQGNVIAVDEGNSNIYIYNKVGDEDHSIISGDLDNGLISPGYKSVGLSANGSIVIADQESRSIIVYDSNGKFLKRYKTDTPSTNSGVRRPKSLVSSYSLGQLKLPTSVANDHHGNVFIADEESGRVVQYDIKNNVFLKQIVSRDDRLQKPWSIASNVQGQLAVVDRNSSVLKLFDISSLM